MLGTVLSTVLRTLYTVLGTVLHTVLGYRCCQVMSVDYSPTGREFVTGGYDRSIRIFRFNQGKSREVLMRRWLVCGVHSRMVGQ